MIEDAIRQQGSFNLVHFPTQFKVDIFIQKDRPFDRAMWVRRQTSLHFDPAGNSVEVLSPEGIVLLKLEWYRLGGEQSDRQWNDILGVLRTQSGRLDDAYLDSWSSNLGVDDLLAKARLEVQG